MFRRGSVSTADRLALERPSFGQVAREKFGLRIAQIETALAEQASRGALVGEVLCQRGDLTLDQARDILHYQAQWVARAMRGEIEAGLPFPARLSVCLPAYNEEPNIVGTLEAARTILPELVRDFELVVVDDGSRDATAQRVEELARHDPRIRLVRHETNRGYGAAVSTGLRAATGDLVMFTDSDGQFSLLDLPLLLARIDRHDFVIGYRYDRADKRIRLLNAWLWGRLVRLLLGVRVRDLDGAFKLFRRDLIERLQLTATGACINAEIMAQCVRAGLSFAEVPVHHYPRYRGAATGANLKVIFKAFRELPQLWKYRSMPPLAATREPARDIVSAADR